MPMSGDLMKYQLMHHLIVETAWEIESDIWSRYPQLFNTYRYLPYLYVLGQTCVLIVDDVTTFTLISFIFL